METRVTSDPNSLDFVLQESTWESSHLTQQSERILVISSP